MEREREREEPERERERPLRLCDLCCVPPMLACLVSGLSHPAAALFVFPLEDNGAAALSIPSALLSAGVRIANAWIAAGESTCPTEFWAVVMREALR